MTAAARRSTNVKLGTWLDKGQYLTIQQAATELGVTVWAVRDAITRGRIIQVHIGHLHLVSGDEVALYRDTRKPSRGHPQQQLDKARRIETERLMSGRRKRPAKKLVYYRHVKGDMVRISKVMADVMALLERYRTPQIRAKFLRVLHQSQEGLPTVGKAVKLLDRLEDAHLVYRIRGRDSHGVDVESLRLSLSGQDALVYCRKRGLI